MCSSEHASPRARASSINACSNPKRCVVCSCSWFGGDRTRGVPFQAVLCWSEPGQVVCEVAVLIVCSSLLLVGGDVVFPSFAWSLQFTTSSIFSRHNNCAPKDCQVRQFMRGRQYLRAGLLVDVPGVNVSACAECHSFLHKRAHM